MFLLITNLQLFFRAGSPFDLLVDCELGFHRTPRRGSYGLPSSVPVACHYLARHGRLGDSVGARCLLPWSLMFVLANRPDEPTGHSALGFSPCEAPSERGRTTHRNSAT